MSDKDTDQAPRGWRFEGRQTNPTSAALDAPASAADRVGIGLEALKRTYRVREAKGQPVKRLVADSARPGMVPEEHSTFVTAREAPVSGRTSGTKVFLRAGKRFVAAQG